MGFILWLLFLGLLLEIFFAEEVVLVRWSSLVLGDFFVALQLLKLGVVCSVVATKIWFLRVRLVVNEVLLVLLERLQQVVSLIILILNEVVINDLLLLLAIFAAILLRQDHFFGQLFFLIELIVLRLLFHVFVFVDFLLLILFDFKLRRAVLLLLLWLTVLAFKTSRFDTDAQG